jgi:hypothetical protein
VSRRIYFYPQAGYSSLPQWQPGHHACAPESATNLLAEYYDCSDKPAPSEGYRLTEYKQDDEAATFDHRGGTTHYRPGPWQVDRVEEYVGNTGMEEHSEIVICHCRYAPLPDHENPWVEMSPAVVSVESFGGDVEAYEAWKATQVVTV